MYHIRANAETAVRNLLRDVAKTHGTNVLTARDYLDDGSPVSQDSLTRSLDATQALPRLNSR